MAIAGRDADHGLDFSGVYLPCEVVRLLLSPPEIAATERSDLPMSMQAAEHALQSAVPGLWLDDFQSWVLSGTTMNEGQQSRVMLVICSLVSGKGWTPHYRKHPSSTSVVITRFMKDKPLALQEDMDAVLAAAQESLGPDRSGGWAYSTPLKLLAEFKRHLMQEVSPAERAQYPAACKALEDGESSDFARAVQACQDLNRFHVTAAGGGRAMREHVKQIQAQHPLLVAYQRQLPLLLALKQNLKHLHGSYRQVARAYHDSGGRCHDDEYFELSEWWKASASAAGRAGVYVNAKLRLQRIR